MDWVNLVSSIKEYEVNLYDQIKKKYKVIYQPQSNEEIKEAVKLWHEDRQKAIDKYGHISLWDTSKITDMSNLFRFPCSWFNDNISDWDVSNVTSMCNMFCSCTCFNQPLNNWNVSNVIDMRWMFLDCVSFNQPLNNWNISNSVKTDGMFMDARFKKEYKPNFNN